MRGIRLSDRLLIVGVSGDGKSTLMRYIVSCVQPVRVIVVNPKEDEELSDTLRGIPVVRDVADLPEALRAPICHWVPDDPLNVKDLDQGYGHIWRCPGPYVLVDDEIAEVTGPNRIAPRHAKIIKSGRAPEKAWFGATQRVSESHPTCRSQAEHVIAMTPAPMGVDLEALARYMNMSPQELYDELEDLYEQEGKHSHLWFVRETREHRRMAPCPPPPYTWPPRLPRRGTDPRDASPPAVRDAPEGGAQPASPLSEERLQVAP